MSGATGASWPEIREHAGLCVTGSPLVSARTPWFLLYFEHLMLSPQV